VPLGGKIMAVALGVAWRVAGARPAVIGWGLILLGLHEATFDAAIAWLLWTDSRRMGRLPGESYTEWRRRPEVQAWLREIHRRHGEA